MSSSADRSLGQMTSNSVCKKGTSPDSWICFSGRREKTALGMSVLCNANDTLISSPVLEQLDPVQDQCHRQTSRGKTIYLWTATGPSQQLQSTGLSFSLLFTCQAFSFSIAPDTLLQQNLLTSVQNVICCSHSFSG